MKEYLKDGKAIILTVIMIFLIFVVASTPGNPYERDIRHYTCIGIACGLGSALCLKMHIGEKRLLFKIRQTMLLISLSAIPPWAVTRLYAVSKKASVPALVLQVIFVACYCVGILYMTNRSNPRLDSSIAENKCFLASARILPVVPTWLSITSVIEDKIFVNSAMRYLPVVELIVILIIFAICTIKTAVREAVALNSD